MATQTTPVAAALSELLHLGRALKVAAGLCDVAAVCDLDQGRRIILDGLLQSLAAEDLDELQGEASVQALRQALADTEHALARLNDHQNETRRELAGLMRGGQLNRSYAQHSP